MRVPSFISCNALLNLLISGTLVGSSAAKVASSSEHQEEIDA